MNKKRLLIFLLFALGCYIVPLPILWAMQDNLLFPAEKISPQVAEAEIPHVGEVILHTADGLALRAWYVEAIGYKPTVLILHGNRDNLRDSLNRLKNYAQNGYGMLVVSWRGYSGNAGAPSKAGLIADAKAGIRFLKDFNVKEEEIIIHGHSLGSGVATALASEYPNIRALILEAPYTSIIDRAKEIYPIYAPFISYIVNNNFSVVEYLSALQVPLLVLHGSQDFTIPKSHSEKIIATSTSAQKKLVIFQNGGHSDLEKHGMFKAIASFLNDQEWVARQ